VIAVAVWRGPRRVGEKKSCTPPLGVVYIV
jgi:hypothetical protein